VRRRRGHCCCACRCAARNDAGDDVRGTDLHHRGRCRARASAAGMGEPNADVAGARLLRETLLRRRVARPEVAPSRHGRADRAGPRRGVRRQRVGDVHRRRRRLLRLGDDVYRAAARARYVELLARRRAGDAVEAVARARPATAGVCARGPRGATSKVSARHRWRKATSCSCDPAARFPPTARASRVAATSRKRS
jgi:hypothetical protein